MKLNLQANETKSCAKFPGREGWIMNIIATVHAPPLKYALCKYLGLPRGCHVLFHVGFFEDNAGKGELGLSVGSNYQGVLGEPLRKKLEELFGLSKTLGDTLIWRDGSGGTWR